jgi:protein TonB
MSSTQTREQPVEIGPKVEWNEPQAVEPASAEPGTPQVLAEVQPTPPAQTDNAQAQPPLPSRVERPKESAMAEPVQSRIKAKPMMVGTGGVLPKPSPPKNSAGAGSYSAAVRSAIGRNKAAATGRGGATVTFAIGPGGGLRAARISKSSGNSALDQAALASVRRAGPFPPPPAGAKSTYSIQIYFH